MHRYNLPKTALPSPPAVMSSGLGPSYVNVPREQQGNIIPRAVGRQRWKSYVKSTPKSPHAHSPSPFPAKPELVFTGCLKPELLQNTEQNRNELFCLPTFQSQQQNQPKKCHTSPILNARAVKGSQQ